MANILLEDDMRDMVSQVGTRTGFSAPGSEEELRSSVIRKAQSHGIALEPGEVTVERTGSGDTSTLYLAADYDATIEFPGFSFALHFNPSAGGK